MADQMIERLFAITRITNGTEGIATCDIEGKVYPLVCATVPVLEKMKEMAQIGADKGNYELMVRNFTNTRIIEYITPKEKKDGDLS